MFSRAKMLNESSSATNTFKHWQVREA